MLSGSGREVFPKMIKDIELMPIVNNMFNDKTFHEFLLELRQGCPLSLLGKNWADQ